MGDGDGSGLVRKQKRGVMVRIVAGMGAVLPSGRVRRCSLGRPAPQLGEMGMPAMNEGAAERVKWVGELPGAAS